MSYTIQMATSKDTAEAVFSFLEKGNPCTMVDDSPSAMQGALPSLGFGGSGMSGMGRHHGIEGFRCI